MASQKVKQARLRGRLRRIAYEAQLLQDVADYVARKGELAPKPQSVVDALKEQIDNTRTEKLAARESITATRTEKQEIKATLQAQLDVAAAKDKAAIRTQIDAVTVEIAEAVEAHKRAAAEIEALRLAKEEALYQERLTQGKLTEADQALVRRDKEAEAALIAENRAALLAKGLLDDPRAAERLANRARVKAALTRTLAENSLHKQLQSAQTTALADNTNSNVFSALDHAKQSYTRAAKNWTAADLTPHMLWNSQTGKGGGIATSPRTAIISDHLGSNPDIGGTVLFVASDGTEVTRTIKDRYSIPGTDLRLLSWDTPLPANVGYAKVLGPSYLNYLPDFPVNDINGSGLVRHSGLYLNRNGQAIPCDVNALSDGSQVQIRQSLGEPQRSMWVPPEAGDSGSPVCFLDQAGTLVLLGVLYSRGGGSAIAAQHDTINRWMASTGYSLTVLDYSPYFNFG